MNTDQPAGRPTWQPVVVIPSVPGEDAYEYAVHAAADGHRVGEVWRYRSGRWRARRNGGSTTAQSYATQAHALAAVGWLETIRADRLTLPHGKPGALPGGPYGTHLVLPDGRAAVVVSVFEIVDDVDCPIRARVHLTGPRLDLDPPAPANGDAMEIDRELVVGLRLMHSDRIALAPPCDPCHARAGQQCLPGCPSRAV